MSEDWKISSLGEIAIINMGQSPSSSSYNEEGIGIYLIQGNADIKNRKSEPRQWTSEPTKNCEVGDILMTVRAPVGAIAKSNHQACIGRGVCSINSNKVDNEYLYQFLLSYESKWKALEQGSTFTAVNGTDIRGVSLLVPPLPEQQKIAEILSTVDAKIELIDQQIAETQALKKGLMQRLLTKGIGHTEFKDSPLGKIPVSWEVGTFKDYTKVNQGLQIPIERRLKEKIDGSYRYITIQFLKKPDDVSNIYYVDSPSKSVICHKDEILMTRTGNTGIVVTNVEGVFHNNFFKVDFERIQFNKDFMYYFLNLDSIQSLIKQYAGGTTIPDINHSDFYKIPLLKPFIEEQQKIASILSAVDDKLEVLTEKKTHYQELKQGLMQQLLTGRIRVKVN